MTADHFPNSAPPDEDFDRRETRTISLMSLFDMILRHGRLIAAFMLVVAMATAVWVLSRPRTYTSSASFLPQAANAQTSLLSGVASQLGLATGSDQSGQSPDFYVSVLKQKSMLGRVVDTQLPSDGRGKGRNLVEILAPSGGPEAKRREAAIAELAARTQVSVDAKIGLVKIAVGVDDATLAKQIVQQFLRLVNDANLEIRRQRAADEGRFIDDRLAATRAELYAAEDRLQSFLRANRELGNVGELVFQRDRLQREVQMRQQIYTSLAQAYEQSRLDQVRDTPVITIVEQPVVPPFPDRRHLLSKTALAAVIGGLLGLLLAWLSEFAGVREPTRETDGQFRRLLARILRALFRARDPKPAHG
jgi:uncharacterized protein involved in exopolysaccharide biosynthesis